jgi:nitrile hydratase subunit beta
MSEPRFKVGQRVRTRVDHPEGHTRIPDYVRGRPGRIESIRRAYPLPDETVRNGRKGEPVTVYGVAFAMADLWGADAEPGSELIMELWESYLDAAPSSHGPASEGSAT